MLLFHPFYMFTSLQSMAYSWYIHRSWLWIWLAGWLL